MKTVWKLFNLIIKINYFEKNKIDIDKFLLLQKKI